ncbi:PR-1-like protein [Meredithblackwellia eburnea MCA 4105]
MRPEQTRGRRCCRQACSLDPLDPLSCFLSTFVRSKKLAFTSLKEFELLSLQLVPTTTLSLNPNTPDSQAMRTTLVPLVLGLLSLSGAAAAAGRRQGTSSVFTKGRRHHAKRLQPCHRNSTSERTPAKALWRDFAPSASSYGKPDYADTPTVTYPITTSTSTSIGGKPDYADTPRITYTTTTIVRTVTVRPSKEPVETATATVSASISPVLPSTTLVYSKKTRTRTMASSTVSTTTSTSTSSASSMESASSTAPAATQTGSGVYDPQVIKSESLSAHNELRALHGAADLTWNDTLVTIASDWAQKCLFEHGSAGSNLAASTSHASTVTSQIRMWSDEQSDYDNNVADADTGHYTQMVWKASTSIGCAFRACDPLTFDGGNTWTTSNLLYCVYHPAGNVIGEYDTNVQ